MPRLIITEGAALGLERCRHFLSEKNQLASKRVALTINRQFTMLASNPHIGRPLDSYPDFRELIIGFGDSGFVALYRVDEINNTVYVLAFRHQKEVSY